MKIKDRPPRTRFAAAALFRLAAATLAGSSFVQAPVRARVLPAIPRVVDHRRLPTMFEANRGQADPRVRFLSRGRGSDVYLTDTGVLLTRMGPDRSAANAMRIGFYGASPWASRRVNDRLRLEGKDPLPGRVSCFRGSDPRRWRTGIPTYAAVRYRHLYPGIDLIFHGRGRRLQYDFIVAPGRDPGVIRLGYRGVRRMTLARSGNLALSTAAGVIYQRKPVAYQERNGERRIVASRYARLGPREVGFRIGRYDRSRPLVIDPTLVYASHLGGGGYEDAAAVATDAQGNAYIAGTTQSTDFPVGDSFGTAKPDPTYSITTDAFVTKIDPAGTKILYSAYLGGGEADQAGGIAVDREGNAYVTGSTKSYYEKGIVLGDYVIPDKAPFPTTTNAFDPTGHTTGSFTFGSDAFVAKIDPTGSRLLYSTYLGGSSTDVGHSIAVTEDGVAVVVGETESQASDDYPEWKAFPTTPGAIQERYAGTDSTGLHGDAFVARIDTRAAGAASLVHSTYLGGKGEDVAYAVGLDASGSACVTGFTTSDDFPVTPNAVQPVNRQGEGPLKGDAFVARLSPAGGLAYSTFLGGGGVDSGNAIAVDSDGSAVVAGLTYSSVQNTPFPTTPGAFQPAQGDPENKKHCMDAVPGYDPTGGGEVWDYFWVMCQDGFVARLNPGGAALAYSSYIGGEKKDWAMAVALDAAGNAWVAGGSEDLPQARGTAMLLPGDPKGGFVLGIDRSGRLVFASQTGPAVTAMAADGAGGIVLTGKTPGALAATGGAFQGAFGGGESDAFAARIAGLPAAAPTPPAARGDVNGDGRINIQDATAVLRAAVGLLVLGAGEAERADVNGDGRINVQDVTLLLRKAAGL